MTKIIPLQNPQIPAEPPAEMEPATPEDHVLLKKLIWVYFWLLILEGALRKWVLPGLANPLLIVRDPVVILIYIVALSRDLFPKNGFIVAILALAVASGVVSEMAGHGTLLITGYGLRTDFLHLPLIFLMAKILTAKDVARIGRWLLILAFPMAALVLAQFRAGPDSLLNVGAGGGIGGQIEVDLGKIRPPGTFAFTSGLVSFLALVAAYVLSAQMRKQSANAKLTTAAMPALGLMLGVSGSRTSIVAVTLIMAGALFGMFRQRELFGKSIKGFIALAVVFLALSSWSEFRTGLAVHESRFSSAGGLQDGIILRTLSGFTLPFKAIATTPLFGEGLGMGTNAAGGILYGERRFLLAEDEWERHIRESGALFGLSFIALRVAIVIYIGRRALAALDRKNPLPLLLFCALVPSLLNGQLGVPTILGFAVFTAGLCLAEAESTETPFQRPPGAARPLPLPVAAPVLRGRSVYAELLHGD